MANFTTKKNQHKNGNDVQDYDVNVYTWASSTLNASSVGTLINTAGKLFHVRIAEGKYEFWWLCILENDI
jgi:hypothetical protein